MKHAEAVVETLKDIAALRKVAKECFALAYYHREDAKQRDLWRRRAQANEDQARALEQKLAQD